MGELPEGWRIVALAEVADTSLGKMLDNARPKGNFRVPYLRNVNVQWGRIDTGDVLMVELSDEERARFALESGDLLVCEGGEIGRCAIWTGGAGYMAYQKALHRVRSRGAIDLRWLRYLLEHYTNTGALAARATGSTILHLPQQHLRQLPVRLPTLVDQSHVIEILEDHLSRLDAASDAIRTAGIRLDRWELAALWDATHGRSAPCTRLDEVREIRLGRQRSPANHTGDRMRPYLRAANVHWNRLRLNDVKEMNFTSTEEDSYRLVGGDILVVEASGSAAEVGKSALYDGAPADLCFQNTLLRLRCRSANPAYVQKYLLAEALAGRLIEESRGVGIHHIGRGRLAALRIEVPSADEQSRRVSRAEAVLAASMRLRSGIDTARERSIAVRRFLLTDAFAGRLTRWTGNDEAVVEPANV